MEVILKENVTWLVINFNLSFFLVRVCVRALNFHADHMDRITVNWNPEQGKKTKHNVMATASIYFLNVFFFFHAFGYICMFAPNAHRNLVSFR